MIPFNKTEEQPVPPLIVQDEFGRKVFNAFTFAASPKESFSDITFGPDYSDPLLELCLFLCDNDPVARNHLLKWIACVKFLPETKPDHAILMHGPFGSGKSTLMEVLKRLVGPPLTTEIDQKLLSQPFNEYLLNCRLLVCEEIKALGDRALYNHLKPLITAKQHTINQKYANHFKVRNVTNCLFMSNFSNAIGGMFGDLTIMSKFILYYTEASEGPRIFFSTGLTIPSKNSLTKDPYFRKTIDMDYGNSNGVVEDSEVENFNINAPFSDKEHKHFAISEGVYRFIVEPSYYYKKFTNPVFLGFSMKCATQISSLTSYEAGNSYELNVTSLFASSKMKYIRDLISKNINFSIGFSAFLTEEASWDGYIAPNSNEFIVRPTIGLLYNTDNFGTFNFSLNTSYFIEGVFQKNEESNNPNFKQNADEIAIMINYRIPMDLYLW